MIRAKRKKITFDFKILLEITNLQTGEVVKELVMTKPVNKSYVCTQLLPHLSHELLQQLQSLIDEATDEKK